MYYYPTLQQLKEMPDLNRYGVVPVCCELYADTDRSAPDPEACEQSLLYAGKRRGQKAVGQIHLLRI